VSAAEYPQALTSRDGKLLHSETTDDQFIAIRELDNLRWMHFGDDAVQAVIKLDEPARIVLPYNIAMLAALLFPERPRKLLNLGVGGGTFERFFSARMPDLGLTSVESSAAVIRLARQFFLVPEQVPVINDSAGRFLNADSSKYDVMFCDVYGDRQRPDCLADNRFYADASRCLAVDGVLVINLLPASEAELLEILLAVRQHFAWVCLLEFPDHRNVLLFVSTQQAPATATLEARAAALSPGLGVDLAGIPARLRRLPEKPL